jgi:hypothetical protein
MPEGTFATTFLPGVLYLLSKMTNQSQTLPYRIPVMLAARYHTPQFRRPTVLVHDERSCHAIARATVQGS